MLEALRQFTLVHAMSAARRQVAADLWTKPIGLNHKPEEMRILQHCREEKAIVVNSL